MSTVELNRLSLQFQLTDPDGPLETDWQRLLNVAADFQLVAGERVIYSEAQFPVVELARQLERWLGRLPSGAPPFAFTSLESDVEGLVRFDPQDGTWSVSSAHSELMCPLRFSTVELESASREFVGRLREAVRQAHGFDIEALR